MLLGWWLFILVTLTCCERCSQFSLQSCSILWLHIVLLELLLQAIRLCVLLEEIRGVSVDMVVDRRESCRTLANSWVFMAGVGEMLLVMSLRLGDSRSDIRRLCDEERVVLKFVIVSHAALGCLRDRLLLELLLVLRFGYWHLSWRSAHFCL